MLLNFRYNRLQGIVGKPTFASECTKSGEGDFHAVGVIRKLGANGPQETFAVIAAKVRLVSLDEVFCE